MWLCDSGDAGSLLPGDRSEARPGPPHVSHLRAIPAPAISVQPRMGFAGTNPVSTVLYCLFFSSRIFLRGFLCRVDLAVFQCCRQYEKKRLQCCGGINSLEFRSVTQATGKRKWKAPILCLPRVIYLCAK